MRSVDAGSMGVGCWCQALGKGVGLLLGCAGHAGMACAKGAGQGMGVVGAGKLLGEQGSSGAWHGVVWSSSCVQEL